MLGFVTAIFAPLLFALMLNINAQFFEITTCAHRGLSILGTCTLAMIDGPLLQDSTSCVWIRDGHMELIVDYQWKPVCPITKDCSFAFSYTGCMKFKEYPCEDFGVVMSNGLFNIHLLNNGHLRAYVWNSSDFEWFVETEQPIQLETWILINLQYYGKKTAVTNPSLELWLNNQLHAFKNISRSRTYVPPMNNLFFGGNGKGAHNTSIQFQLNSITSDGRDPLSNPYTNSFLVSPVKKQCELAKGTMATTINCFSIVESPLSWTDADADCKHKAIIFGYPKGRLARVVDFDTPTMVAILTLLSTYNRNVSARQALWFNGGEKLRFYLSQKWTYLSRYPPTYVNLPPEAFGKEYTNVNLCMLTTAYGTYSEVDCSQKRNYVCEFYYPCLFDNPCRNRGQCQSNADGEISCKCWPGTSGQYCQTGYPEAVTLPSNTCQIRRPATTTQQSLVPYITTVSLPPTRTPFTVSTTPSANQITQSSTQSKTTGKTVSINATTVNIHLIESTKNTFSTEFTFNTTSNIPTTTTLKTLTSINTPSTATAVSTSTTPTTITSSNPTTVTYTTPSTTVSTFTKTAMTEFTSTTQPILSNQTSNSFQSTTNIQSTINSQATNETQTTVRTLTTTTQQSDSTEHIFSTPSTTSKQNTDNTETMNNMPSTLNAHTTTSTESTSTTEATKIQSTVTIVSVDTSQKPLSTKSSFSIETSNITESAMSTLPSITSTTSVKSVSSTKSSVEIVEDKCNSCIEAIQKLLKVQHDIKQRLISKLIQHNFDPDLIDAWEVHVYLQMYTMQEKSKEIFVQDSNNNECFQITSDLYFRSKLLSRIIRKFRLPFVLKGCINTMSDIDALWPKLEFIQKEFTSQTCYTSLMKFISDNSNYYNLINAIVEDQDDLDIKWQSEWKRVPSLGLSFIEATINFTCM